MSRNITIKRGIDIIYDFDWFCNLSFIVDIEEVQNILTTSLFICFGIVAVIAMFHSPEEV